MQNTPDMSQLMQLAGSPAGQKLLTLLQRSGGKALQDALVKASAGEYAQAGSILTQLLDNEEAKALLAQLGGQL